jgi:hypothetical protein
MKNVSLLLLLYLLTIKSLSAQSETVLSSAQPKSYFNLTQLSYLIAEEDQYSPVKSSMAPSLVNINGFCINENVSLGIGAGVTALSYMIFPVFADFRITFLKGNLNPVLSLKGGYAFANNKKKLFNEYYGDFKNTGGGMFHPEVGFKVNMTENLEFLLTVGYWYQHVKSEIKYGDYYHGTHNRISDLNRLSFSIGFLFK